MSRVKPENIYVCDFETTPESQYLKEGRTRIWLYYLENLNNERNKMGLSIDDMFNYLSEMREDKTKKVTQLVYFHNLKFDGAFILHWLKENDFIPVKKGKLKPGQFSSIIGFNGTTYSLEIKLSTRHTVRIWDSYLVLNAGVADLPGSTKGEIDYKKEHYEKSLSEVPDDEKQYIIDDVQSVKRNLQAFFKMGLKGMTISSMAYNSWKVIHEKRAKKGLAQDFRQTFPFIPDNVNNKIRRFYMGGFNYLNPMYQGVVINGIIISLDLHSSYPGVMLRKPMPVGKPVVLNGRGCYQKYKKIYERIYPLHLVEVHIPYAKIKDGYHPFLGFKTQVDTKKEYRKELIACVLHITHMHYQMFLDYYDCPNHEIKEVIAFRQETDIFKEYLDYWGDIKANSKGYKKDTGKKMMNHLYGKFATQQDRTSRLPNFDDEVIKFDDYQVKLPSRYYLPIGVFIPAYGQEVLIRAIQEEREQFLYCDTDSIYLKVPNENYRPNIEIHDSKLGAWGFEGVSDKIKWLKNKQYLKHMTKDENMNPVPEKEALVRKIASLSRKSHKRINFQNFHKDFKVINGKLMPKRVVGGIILVDSDMVFRGGGINETK